MQYTRSSGTVNSLPTQLGDNGGPPLDGDIPRMREIRLHIRDWMASVRGLTVAQEGFYWRITLLFYERMGPIPDDDQVNARATNLDIRIYRRLKGELIALCKLHVRNGMMSHPRVIREIEKWVDEWHRRSAVGRDREAARRQVREKSATSSQEVRDKSGQLVEQLSNSEAKKTKEINETGPDVRAETDLSPRARGRDPSTHVPIREEVKGNSPDGEPPPSPSAPGEQLDLVDAIAKAEALAQVDTTKVEELAEAKAAKAADVRWAFEAYNTLAARCGLSKGSKLTAARERALRQRLSEFGREGWERALSMVERSAFLRGRNDRHWRADLDFLLQASSFAKVHDGRYGNGAHVERVITPQEQAAADDYARQLAAVAEFGALDQ